MKPSKEMREGSEAFTRFDATVGKLLSVSHNELKRREAEYQNKAKSNPKKRGPKAKQK